MRALITLKNFEAMPEQRHLNEPVLLDEDSPVFGILDDHLGLVRHLETAAEIEVGAAVLQALAERLRLELSPMLAELRVRDYFEIGMERHRTTSTLATLVLLTEYARDQQAAIAIQSADW